MYSHAVHRLFTNVHPDSQVIDELGGPAKVAELLGYDKTTGGIQRVHNWRSRGIPPKVKLERPDLFLMRQGVAQPVEVRNAA